MTLNTVMSLADKRLCEQCDNASWCDRKQCGGYVDKALMDFVRKNK